MSFPYSGSEKAEQLFPVGTQNTRIHHVHMYTCPQLAAWMNRVRHTHMSSGSTSSITRFPISGPEQLCSPHPPTELTTISLGCSSHPAQGPVLEEDCLYSSSCPLLITKSVQKFTSTHKCAHLHWLLVLRSSQAGWGWHRLSLTVVSPVTGHQTSIFSAQIILKKKISLILLTIFA